MGRFSEDSTFGDKSLLDFIYPIGSIYYTIDDSFDPNEYWGGTWEEINDKFIYGTSVKTEGNNNHLSKQTGGEKTHKLTINEMPSHEHKVRKRVGTTNDSYLASYKTNVSAGTLWIMPADTSWDNPDHYYAQAVGGGLRTTTCHLITLLIFGIVQLKEYIIYLLSNKRYRKEIF